ncbi:DUF4126 family protein [Segetibacter koreensis]|uniref:DUF4126 family protein n=1 Tax=Segetibacter koreensis TaxID=398037 RepID=UPI00037F986F|nr:DUF4126 family protein [Segetibacter koreensis]
MKKINEKTIGQIISLGIISGMRSTFALAIAAHYLSKQHNSALSNSRLRFIQSPVTAIVTKLLGVAEIAGDKLPNTPNRIVAPQVIARAASGALAGAIISVANKDSVAKGILIGRATAIAATYGTFYLRKYLDKSTFIKEPVTGAIEDAIVIGSGILIMG